MNDASFAELPLSSAMLGNLDRLGYATMTPIQAASLPITLAGSDLIAQAKTGSGKTAAFAIPLLAKIDSTRFDVQALVLCPTRELAEQVTHELRRLARAEDNIKILTLAGGVMMRGQRASLEHGAHIVVGTPGRIMDLLDRGNLELGAVNTLVLDEADRMLDMGFHHDITYVAKRVPTHRQTLLFSATYPEGIAKLAEQFMRRPKRITVEARHDDRKIRQLFFEVQDSDRLMAVATLLNHYRPTSTLAFCNTKARCNDLVEQLSRAGFSAQALHGELEQRDRDQVLVQFANRSCSVLVATDVAARGLDIAHLEAVINVDVTPEPELHVHRIGRTGRADNEGLTLSLASGKEMGRVNRLEDEQGRPVKWADLATLTPASDRPLVPPMATIQIQVERKEKIRAGDVLGALTGAGGIAGDKVGKITIGAFSTYVAVQRDVAKAALKHLGAAKIKGKTVRVRLL
ncbi:MAG: ATP-dependent RNA helicase DbpA [Burkholderiales bacterium]|nr:ATP-dependent RNA helicase DbpA [Burkholderiales bacterium]